MKQYTLLLLMLAYSYYVVGQEDALIIKESTKINRQLVPGPVLDSLHSLFPGAIGIEFYNVPPMTARNSWAVDCDSLVPYNDSLQYYLVVCKRGELKFYSMFTAEGLLIMTKQKDEVTELPVEVRQSLKDIRKDYPGFKVRSSGYYRNENRDRHLYYEVIAERGNRQQRFFYDGVGTLVKIDVIQRESN